MIGISTCWRSGKTEDGFELLDMMCRSGLSRIELEYRITAEMYEQIKPILKQRNPQVVCVHNFFPVPEIFPKRNMGGGDAFFLSSPDVEERIKAIKYTKRTIQIANDLEATAVVLHLGKVEMPSGMKQLFRFYDDNLIESTEPQAFIEQNRRERQNKRAKFLDNVMFSLEEILKEALRQNIILGIENAFKINGIPDFDEIGLFLEKFKGAPLGYWHDVGHAQVKQNLGWHNHLQLLDTYKDSIIGIHLHDIKGYKDHLAPGLGEFDFSLLKQHIPENSIKIIEVHEETTEEELLNGISFLKERGFG